MAELDTLINEPSEAEKRIKQLSGKVESMAGERDAEKSAREAAEAKAAESERKAQFAESFTDIVANNPAAKDYKADIQAKVLSGYTPEDAAYAVLGKAGKLGQPKVDQEDPAGGSAANPPPSGEKSAADMSQEERRAKLKELYS